MLKCQNDSFNVVISGFTRSAMADEWSLLSEGLEMFCFSIMESSFCFANVKFITVLANSFIDDFGPLCKPPWQRKRRMSGTMGLHAL